MNCGSFFLTFALLAGKQAESEYVRFFDMVDAVELETCVSVEKDITSP
jgi:hypothetical protein